MELGTGLLILGAMIVAIFVLQFAVGWLKDRQ
jgi:hypothetical protein